MSDLRYSARRANVTSQTPGTGPGKALGGQGPVKGSASPVKPLERSPSLKQITLEGEDRSRLKDYQDILWNTAAGYLLLDKDLKTEEIHIKTGSLGDLHTDPRLGETNWHTGLFAEIKSKFIKSEPAQTVTVTIDVNKIKYRKLDDFDAAEVLYHELYAHIKLHHYRLEQYEADLNKISHDQGINGLNIKYIRNSITKFKDELDQEQQTIKKIEHIIYGSDHAPLDPKVKKNTPAGEIKEQLNKLRMQCHGGIAIFRKTK
jgi:hypothetical protein